MFRKSLFTTGLCAASLSVAMLAGCSSPVTAPTTPTEATSAPVAGTGAPAAPVSEPAAPALPAPAAAAPATLSGKATYRGDALAGYAVSVFDAQTGKAVELKADLAGVNTLAILNQNLVTDAQGGFSLQVVGLKAGQALRVVVSKGNGTLETVVTSDLKAVGSAKLHVLAEGGNLTINELTTAIAKVARGVLSTTQVLTPEAAAPVLAKLATEMASLSGKLEAALAKNPNLAPGLIAGESQSTDSAVKSLVESANALKDLTKTIAGLVADVAKAAKETGNQSSAANDALVKAALTKVEFAGTVLSGAFANNGFTLTNSLTGEDVDANAADFGDVTEIVTRPSTGSNGPSPAFSNPFAAGTLQVRGDNVTGEAYDTEWITAGRLYQYNLNFTDGLNLGSFDSVEVDFFKDDVKLGSTSVKSDALAGSTYGGVSGIIDSNGTVANTEDDPFWNYGTIAAGAPDHVEFRLHRTEGDLATSYTFAMGEEAHDGLSGGAVYLWEENDTEDYLAYTKIHPAGSIFTTTLTLGAERSLSDFKAGEVSLYDGDTKLATHTLKDTAFVSLPDLYRVAVISYDLRVEFHRGDAAGSNDMWNTGTFPTGTPTKAVYKLTDKNGYVHSYEVPLTTNLFR